MEQKSNVIADQTGDKGPATEAAKPDPFAGLPTIKVGESEVLDLSSVEGNNPFKYEKVAADAATDKLPVKRGWKHMTAMFVKGHNNGPEGGFKPGSVYGTIQQVVAASGKAGISAADLATEVRKRQIGNKRSKYCEKLPPVGWAEGWVDTAVTKSIINVHATKKAPALVVTAPAGTEATPAQDRKAIAAS